MKKILNLEEAISLNKKLKTQSKKIVLVGGCFDILHKGHMAFLKNAKRQGDILFVALESDENTRKLKGTSRPVNNQQKRAEILAKLSDADVVILLPSLASDEQYTEMTTNIAPNIIAITKGDPKESEKQKQAEAIGAKVAPVIERIVAFSTTKLLEKHT